MTGNSLSNVWQRSLTAVVLIPVVLGAVLAGGPVFAGALAIVTVLLIREWHNLTQTGVLPQNRWLGFLVIVAWCALLYKIRQLPGGVSLFLYFLFSIWVADTSAYVFGKLIKGYKLWPEISPNKTWAGFIGGLLAGGVFSVLWAKGHEPLLFFLYGMVFSFLVQAGDLSVSKIKRHLKVKDSGGLFPGHGGILDRMDGFLYTVPFYILTLKVLF